MLIRTKMCGEDFDLVIGGLKVQKALMRILARKYKIKFFEAKKMIDKEGQLNLEKKYYKQLKVELFNDIKEEQNMWRAYESELEKEKKEKEHEKVA